MKKRKEIKNLVSKPSEVIRAMLTGIEEAEQSSVCRVLMTTFGSSPLDFSKDKTPCFGCAATYTLWKLSGKSFNRRLHIINSTERSESFGFDLVDLWVFENAVDGLRQGELEDIYNYFNIPEEQRYYIQDLFPKATEDDFCLGEDYEEKLPNFLELSNKLGERGL